MRTEQEMYDLILKVANEDRRVRAVAINGSRTNENAPKDIFQDYDIVYLVNDMASFLEEPNWVDVFGERVIMQTPDDNSLIQVESIGRYAYLMLFTDGNRIDLTLIPIDKRDAYLQEDKLTKILLDKDGVLPRISSPTDQDYWVEKPTQDQYLDCCNEFWWISTYVAKGLWREEILYALDHLNRHGRPMLLKMFEWQVGTERDFSVSVGKSYKYLEEFLSEEIWKRALVTFPEASYEKTWVALFEMIELFRETATIVGDRLDFDYPTDWDQRVTSYLKQVKHLPKNATDFK